MSGAPLFVAIDNGSQSTKVSVIDGDGVVVAFVQNRLRPSQSPVPGHVVHPDDDLWHSISSTCAEAIAALGSRVDDVVGAGLCTIRFCRAYLDADGLLTEPVLSWMDERVSAPVADVDPRMRFVTTSSGYITHRLTGQFRDTAGNYQGLWPIDQNTWRWSHDPDAYVRTGMRQDQLFELVEPGAPLGTITPAAADATRLPAGLPVYATSNDKAVEALGSGLRDERTVLLSLGTYIASMAVGDAKGGGAVAGAWRNFGAAPGQYLYESDGIRRGMWTVSWYRDLLGNGVTEDELNVGAQQVAPGSNGLLSLLDWLAPGDAEYRRGALLGFDGSQGRFEIHRSIIEGIAFTMAERIDELQSGLGRRFESVTVSGGGSRSAFLLQVVSDVLGLPCQRMRMPDGAGIGAAITAAVGSGVYANWDAAADHMVHVEAVIQPDATSVAAYRPYRAAHAGLRSRTDPLFRWLQSTLRP